MECGSELKERADPRLDRGMGPVRSGIAHQHDEGWEEQVWGTLSLRCFLA